MYVVAGSIFGLCAFCDTFTLISALLAHFLVHFFAKAFAVFVFLNFFWNFSSFIQVADAWHPARYGLSFN